MVGQRRAKSRMPVRFRSLTPPPRRPSGAPPPGGAPAGRRRGQFITIDDVGGTPPAEFTLRASSKGQDDGFSTRQYRFESGCPCHLPRDGGRVRSVALAGIVQGSRQRFFTPRIPVRIRLPVPRRTRRPFVFAALADPTPWWGRRPATPFRSGSIPGRVSALSPRPAGSQAPVFETGWPGSTPGGGAMPLRPRAVARRARAPFPFSKRRSPPPPVLPDRRRRSSKPDRPGSTPGGGATAPSLLPSS